MLCVCQFLTTTWWIPQNVNKESDGTACQPPLRQRCVCGGGGGGDEANSSGLSCAYSGVTGGQGRQVALALGTQLRCPRSTIVDGGGGGGGA